MFQFRKRSQANSEAIASLSSLLSSAWAQPDVELAQNFREHVWQRQLTEVAQELGIDVSTKITPSTTVLNRAVSAATLTDSKIDHENLMIDLASEYAALYQGPGAPLVRAYECQWVDGERASLFIAPSAMAVEAAYRDAGVVMSNNEPPDSLTAELEFISQLARAEMYGNAAEAKDYSAQRQRFVVEHIDRWVPAFCTATEQATEHGAYAALARITQAIVETGVLKT